jgi:hypothetical protein
MDTAMLLLAMLIAGVNFGWQSAEDGSAGYEYIVQVEPELVEAMQRGKSVPIESNIPPDVTPIRKVRIVVGRGELPRTPLRHTANFAGQAGWTPDRYPAPPTANSSYDRYPASAGRNATGVSPPPTVLDRTQTAVTESGAAITDGLQAGMRSASEQLSRAGGQAMSDTQNAAQQFGQQLQQWTDNTGRQIQSAGNSLRNATEQTLDATGNQIRQAGNSLGLTGNRPTTTGAGGVSAPPWPASSAQSGAPPSWAVESAPTRGAVTDTTASAGMAVTRTATGWTSIGTNVAAPPLLNPPLSTATDSGTNVRIAQGGIGGPNFPPTSTPASSEPLHSVLVDPSRQPAATNAATNDWGNAWGTGATAMPATPATIGRSGEASRSGDAASNTGLVPVQPRNSNPQGTEQAADRWGDAWAQAQSQQNTTPQTAGSATNAGPVATNDGWPTNGISPAPASVNTAVSQPFIGQAPATSNSTGSNTNPGLQSGSLPGGNLAGVSPPASNPAGGNIGANQGPMPQQLPWLPLLVVSLSLVGSLSANLYLGMSYIGARQKYVSLVQKTADTFRRATGAAAAA